MDRLFYGTVQEFVPWHMTNVPDAEPPFGGMQAGSLLVNVHAPQTTPLESVPVVVLVPFEVPFIPPLGLVESVRLLLLVVELIV